MGDCLWRSFWSVQKATHPSCRRCRCMTASCNQQSFFLSFYVAWIASRWRHQLRVTSLWYQIEIVWRTVLLTLQGYRWRHHNTWRRWRQYDVIARGTACASICCVWITFGNQSHHWGIHDLKRNHTFFLLCSKCIINFSLIMFVVLSLFFSYHSLYVFVYFSLSCQVLLWIALFSFISTAQTPTYAFFAYL